MADPVTGFTEKNKCKTKEGYVIQFSWLPPGGGFLLNEQARTDFTDPCFYAMPIGRQMATKNLSITSFLSLILRYWINEPRQVEFIQMSIIFFCEYSSYYKTFDKKKNLINQQTNRITLPRHPNPNAIGRSKGYLYKRTD